VGGWCDDDGKGVRSGSGKDEIENRSHRRSRCPWKRTAFIVSSGMIVVFDSCETSRIRGLGGASDAFG